MVEIRQIPGTKFINPASEPNVPFQLVKRTHVSRPQYHELPSNEGKHNVVFGKKVLDMYKRLTIIQGVGLPDKNIQVERKRLSKVISESKKDLSIIIKYSREPLNKNYKIGASNFFTHAFNNEEIRKKYIDLYRQYLERNMHSKRPIKLPIDIQSPTDMIDTFKVILNTIPDDLYLEMIIEYSNRFKETTNTIRSQLIEYYDSSLKLAVRDFAMHHGIDVMDVSERMEELKKRLVIYFDDSRVFSESQKAGFTNLTGQITLSTFLDIDEMKHAFVHEIFHNLAGHSYRVQIDELASYEGEEGEEGLSHTFYAVVPEKHGMGFYNALRFLDEGLTDFISHEVFPLKKSKVGYSDIKSLLTKIMNIGKKQISMDLALQSYFEEHNPNILEDKQFPKTKEFLRAVSDSWSPGFLIRLDKLIRSYGRLSSPAASSAVEAMNENFTEVTKILMRIGSVADIIPEAKNLLYEDVKKIVVVRKLMQVIKGIK